MKKIISLLLLTVVLFACEKDLPVSNTPDASNTLDDLYTWNDLQKLIKKSVEGYDKNEEIPETEPFYYFGDEEAIARVIHTGENTSWEGPFEAEVTKNKVAANKKVLHNGEGGLEEGIYVFDIFSFSAEIDLPPNTVGTAKIPDPAGYSNVSDQSKGITYYMNSSPDGTRFVIQTYAIQAKSRLSGEAVNHMLPEPIGENFSYTYYYTKTAP